MRGVCGRLSLLEQIRVHASLSRDGEGERENPSLIPATARFRFYSPFYGDGSIGL